jgi:hypothetical protein
MSGSATSLLNATQAVSTGSSLANSIRTEPLTRILLIEPGMPQLSAETLLLTESNHCVTLTFSQLESFISRDTKAVAFAIISDSLGPRLLSSVAAAVRMQWPRARILIPGRAATMPEDHLYDEQAERSMKPTQLLEDLERLYKDSWSEHPSTIAWRGLRPVRLPLLESDPSKTLLIGVADNKALRDMPSGIVSRSR